MAGDEPTERRGRGLSPAAARIAGEEGERVGRGVRATWGRSEEQLARKEEEEDEGEKEEEKTRGEGMVEAKTPRMAAAVLIQLKQGREGRKGRKEGNN